MKKLLLVVLCALVMGASQLSAGVITSVGSVTALTHVNQMTNICGTATFDEGPTSGAVPLNTYTPQGMTFHTGPLTSILSGVTTPGGATAGPQYNDWLTAGQFPGPIAGGGVAAGIQSHFAGVATFNKLPQIVTQVGLTASNNGNQYLTAWDTSGVMLGQVNWAPASDSAFVGIDTNGVAIGMIAYGNDDLFSGATYNLGGATNISDTWVWNSVPEPSSFMMFAIAATFLGRRRRN